MVLEATFLSALLETVADACHDAFPRASGFGMIRVTRHPEINVPIETLEEIYAELPTIECRRQCQWYCRNIQMAATEFDRIRGHLGFTPRSNPVDPDPCPMLSADGGCRAYAVRPLICRLWSIVETMQCPWGCVPSPRYLTEEEAFALLLRSGAFGRPLAKEEAELAAQESLKCR